MKICFQAQVNVIHLVITSRCSLSSLRTSAILPSDTQVSAYQPSRFFAKSRRHHREVKYLVSTHL